MVIERRYYLCSRYARFNWWSVEATVSPFISLVVFFSLSLTADGREAYPMTLIVMMMIRPAEAGRESGWPQEETQQVGQSGRGWETVARFPTRLFRARRHASDRKKVKRNWRKKKRRNKNKNQAQQRSNTTTRFLFFFFFATKWGRSFSQWRLTWWKDQNKNKIHWTCNYRQLLSFFLVTAVLSRRIGWLFVFRVLTSVVCARLLVVSSNFLSDEESASMFFFTWTLSSFLL